MNGRATAPGLALGIDIGTAFGVATDNLAVGLSSEIAIGQGRGLAVASQLSESHGDGNDDA